MIDDNIVETSHEIQKIISVLKFRPISIWVSDSININNICGLEIDDTYNQQICGTLPNLRSLLLGKTYNHPLDTIIAKKCNFLDAKVYNQPLLKLPFKYFNCYFNYKHIFFNIKKNYTIITRLYRFWIIKSIDNYELFINYLSS